MKTSGVRYSRHSKKAHRTYVWLFTILMISTLALSACGAAVPAVAPAATLANSAVSAVTSGPTATATPSFPLSAGTPLPTSFPKITTQNAKDLTELARWGKDRGTLVKAMFAPDSRSIAVVTSSGVYLFDAATLDAKPLNGVSTAVADFQFSPTGKLLAVVPAAHSFDIQLLNAADGALLNTLSGHKGTVTSLAFSPDGAILASGSADKTINIWQTADGKLMTTIKGHRNPVYLLRFSPDGQVLDSCSKKPDDSDLQVVSYKVTPEGAAPVKGGGGSIDRYCDSTIAYSGNGSLIASGVGAYSHKITVKNVADINNPSKHLQEISLPEGAKVTGLALSPDGQYVAAASVDKDEKSAVQLWKVSSDAAPAPLVGFPPSTKSGSSVTSLTFSPDGKTLALISGNAIATWSLPEGTLLKESETQTGYIGWASLSPDGKTLVAPDEGGIALWQISDGSASHKKELSDGKTFSVAFSSDGKSLITGEIGAFSFWSLSGTAASASFQEMSGPFILVPTQFAVSADGRLVAARSLFNSHISIYSAADGKSISGADMDSGVNFQTLAFSPDGNFLAMGNGSLKIAQTKDWKVTQKLQGSGAAFSPDGKFLAFGQYDKDKTVQLWSVPDFKPVSQLGGPIGAAESLAFSPDASVLAAGTEDGQIWLWNVSDGTLLQKLQAHNNAVRQLFFTPDGKLLISLSPDATIRLWGLKP